jgi:pyruvate carboxylase subunit B
MAKKIGFMCTAFRDGLQSVYGARVRSEDYIEAVKAAVEAGITYLETAGGALFQSAYFYCQEDGFDVMDAVREAAGKDAVLQSLARGVNVVGLESQPTEMINLHAKLFKKHGVTTIRNFDALNDLNNLIPSAKAIVDAELKHQITVTMMGLPPRCKGNAHSADFYVNIVKQIIAAKVPFDSIAFKDASGTSVPSIVHDVVKETKKLISSNTTVHFHTHETAGASVTAYKAAIEAGADFIDLSLAPVSGGTSNPDILVMWNALRGSPYQIDIDPDKVRNVEAILKESLEEYFLPPEALSVEPIIPWSPMPGGALTTNTQMLRDNNLMEKYPDMISNMTEVVEKGGFGTSVTPVSQFYIQQAFNNALHKPWDKIADGYGKMVLGYFGKTPVAPDPEIVKIASQQLELPPTTKTVIELNDSDETKGIQAAKKALEAQGLPISDENIFIVAACKEKGVAFLQGKGELGIRKGGKSQTASGNGEYTVTLNGRKYAVKISGDITYVDGNEYQTEIVSGIERMPTVAAAGAGIPIKSPMPGKIFKVLAKEGDDLSAGDPLLVIEVMKMENEVLVEKDGLVTEVLVKPGDMVQEGDVLALLALKTA